MDIDGNNLRQLTDSTELSEPGFNDYERISWSPNSTQLVVEGWRNRAIGLIDTSSGEETYPLIPGADMSRAYSPDWSPWLGGVPPTPVPTPVITPTSTPVVSGLPANVGEYAVLASNSVWLRQGSQLHSGHVAAQSISPGPVPAGNAEVTVGINVAFHHPASLVAADTVKLKRGGASVFNIYYSELDPGDNVTPGQLFTPLTEAPGATMPGLPAITPGNSDYTLAQNESLTLPAGAYGDIKLKKSAVLTLSGGIYHLAGLDLGDKSQVRVTAPTEIRIAGRLGAGQNAGPAPSAGSDLNAADLLVTVAGINGNSGKLSSTPKAAVIGLHNQITATLYAPNGTLWLRQGSQARGAFIGKDVEVGENVQVWLESTFVQPTPPVPEPTEEPTVSPPSPPTSEPTAEPTEDPTAGPPSPPTTEPTAEPTEEPTVSPRHHQPANLRRSRRKNPPPKQDHNRRATNNGIAKLALPAQAVSQSKLCDSALKTLIRIVCTQKAGGI